MTPEQRLSYNAKQRSYYKKNREQILKYYKDKRESDPDFRAKKSTYSKEYYDIVTKNKEASQ